MAFSKKDDGYIRANEGVPYLENQLCGLLNITPELLNRTIKKCIKYDKAKRFKDGTIYMTSHDVYKLSDRQERRVEKEMSAEEDATTKKQDAILDKNKIEDNRKEDKKDKVEKFDQLFKEFWQMYPKKIAKDYTKEKFMILAKKGLIPELIKAMHGYLEYLKTRRIHDNFKQEPLNPATFLMKNRWKDYIDFKYKPKL